MIPILLGRQVATGLKDLVRATFNTTTPAFDGTVETFLSDPHNFLKGPWISLAMPFRTTEGLEEYFPDLPLGFSPYQHQLNAFERLGGNNPKSTMIATGTGSGKTESYLWPIFDHCRNTKDQKGIKAILIYPMNALATDQARRIAKAIHTVPALNGLRCGIYADEQPENASGVMLADDVITRRQAMWDNPPDILLTNYKMLDYLLLRGQDKELWTNNAPDTLRYLVVDELHTFDGAQGADLALLIRRLKARLETPEDHLVCVGSSATLGSGVDAQRELVKYASTIFGEEFESGSIVTEDRQSASEILDTPAYIDKPNRKSLAEALETASDQTQAEAALTLARCLFPDIDDDESFNTSEDANSASDEWRLQLGEALELNLVAQQIIRIVDTRNGLASLDEIAADLSDWRLLRGWSHSELAALAECVVSLIAWGRSGKPGSLRPLFNARIQYWVREMARMVSSIPQVRDGGDLSASDLAHSDDLTPMEKGVRLPVIHCNSCGASAHLGRMTPSGDSLWAKTDVIYADWFGSNSDGLRLVFYENLHSKGGLSGAAGIVEGQIHPEHLNFDMIQHASRDAASKSVPCWLFNPTKSGGGVDNSCPACGMAHSLQIFGLRAARLTSSLAGTLYNSAQNEEDAEAKPRLLTFSDSVQDAAQRASVAEIRNSGLVNRKALFQSLRDDDVNAVTINEAVNEIPKTLNQDLGDETFIGKFTALDQTWRRVHEELCLKGRLNDLDPQEVGKFLTDVRLRLGWEFFADLTYRSHTSQTLEALRLGIADVSPAEIEKVAEQLPEYLEVHAGFSSGMSTSIAAQFLSGLLQHMRRQGAVLHRYLEIAMEHHTSRYGPGYFAAARVLGVSGSRALPVPSHRRGAAPRPVTTRRSLQGYVGISSDGAGRWFKSWAYKLMPELTLAPPSILKDVFEAVFQLLEKNDLVRCISAASDENTFGYVIDDEAIIISPNLQVLRCDTCKREDVSLASDRFRSGSPCSRMSCDGHVETTETRPNNYAKAIYGNERSHRVVARENTGILESDARRKLETDFISGEDAWSPNLISATPTLEMGIDIGDLSTVLLCSVPPAESNYIQRIGRSGRRDGNSLNMTIANARSHDLQYWAEPESMLEGDVSTPGVFLQAVAVLKRQVAAFTLDRLVATGSGVGEYGKVKNLLAALDGNSPEFPNDWFQFLEENGNELCRSFLAMLPSEIQANTRLADEIQIYLSGSDDKTLIWQVRSIFNQVRVEREQLREFIKELDNEQRRLRRLQPPPTDLNEKIDDIRRNKQEINHSIREDIDNLHALALLTDRGVLPNYAFPETGIKLKSLLVFSAERRDAAGNTGKKETYKTREFMRPASSALSELAPWQTFYAEGRQVEIDRIEIDSSSLVSWRFCQNCTHIEKDDSSNIAGECPKCGHLMWSDAGSTHEAVELKTVVAVTPEREASIRDRDDRNVVVYDREMLPSYPDSSIEHSWSTQGKKSKAPFGYEFVSQCEFRDFNFGEIRVSGSSAGVPIAGRERNSEPFEICRHCGKLQKHGVVDDPKSHQPRCIALRDDLAREDWISKIFLMRRFSTEAIRIIMPVVGEPDHDEIKSFVAGIELGMRKHFKGKVDHIRSTVVEEQLGAGITVRSLYLYDSIPGGSGYLRQLAEHPETMKRIVERAAQTLRDCVCAAQEADGCFRCVKSYRSQFGKGEPSRYTALSLMEDILEQWSDLKKADTGVDKSLKHGLVDSHLEKRFLSALTRCFGANNLKPLLVNGSTPGFQLNVGTDKAPIFWEIETQVQIEKRFAGLPKKRIDFLMTPKGSLDALPVVIETDGLEYHVDTAADDIETRLLMIRSGKVQVWSFAWRDLDIEPVETVRNPLSPGRLGPEVEGLLARLVSQVPQLRDCEGLSSGLSTIRTADSFSAFCSFLVDPRQALAEAATLISRVLAGAQPKPVSSLTGIELLSSDGRDFLEDTPLHAVSTDNPISLFMSAPNSGPAELLKDLTNARFVMHASLPAAQTTEAKDFETLSPIWRGMWRIINFLQFHPGFHVEFPGLTTLSAPAAKAGADLDVSDVAWTEVEEMVIEEFGSLIHSLKSAAVTPPDLIGSDAMSGDAVLGMLEIGWSDHKLGVSENSFELSGWKIIQFSPPHVDEDPPDPNAPDLMQIVKNIIEALEGNGS